MGFGVERIINLFDVYVGGDNISIPKVTSGVAVVVWDPIRKISAACHIFSAGSGVAASGFSSYVEVESTIDKMLQLLGVDTSTIVRLRAKISGCSDIPGLKLGFNLRNRVLGTLKMKNVPIGGFDTGGSIGRNIRFNPKDGKMFVEYFTGGGKVV